MLLLEKEELMDGAVVLKDLHVELLGEVRQSNPTLLHCTTIDYTTLHYTKLQYIKLHCTTLR